MKDVLQLALWLDTVVESMSNFLSTKIKNKEKYELNDRSEGGVGKDKEKEYGSITSLVNNEWELQYTTLKPVSNQVSEEQVPLKICRGKDDITTFFKDQKRKVDFVLVFEEDKKDADIEIPKELEGTELGVAAAAQQFKKLGKKKQRFKLWRKKFLAGLQTVGLEIEDEVADEVNSNVHFFKLHAPWPILCKYAEELNLRAPLQAHPNPSVNWTEWALSKLYVPNPMSEEVPNKPLDYYTCPFKMSKLDRFLGSEDRDKFFTRAQRSRMVYEILSATTFGREKKGEVGISRLVEEGTFDAAFPLHDGPYKYPGPEVPHDELNNRQILYEFWARWGKWYKYQPLDHIRDYFGEQIAIYFAWLGFYTGWLLPAALVGLGVFLYGLFTLDHNVSAREVCSDEARNITMCPQCTNCSTWPLYQICYYTRIAYLFDHPGTVFYAVFMSFWAVTFLEYWKRKSASLAHHWDCMGFQDEEERPRPEFAANAPYLEKNPITGIKEPSFPQAVRMRRIAAGSGLIILMIMLVLIFILAVIIYRTLASIYLFNIPTTRPIAQILSSTSGAVINLMAIMAMGRVYESLALKLTRWEMHRTQSDFDDNLTFKVFIFQFINFYSSIIYIAFFKGKFVGYPGAYINIVGNLRNEDCGNGGCLIELAQQLAVIMIGKQIINNAQEIIIPKLKGWWQNFSSALSSSGGSQTEQDYLLVENEGLFQEYLEMVLQFGFITIFVAAFPLAPLFALLNNWVEIRLDAQKFVCETRRAVAERAENIGIWFKILEMLAKLAVISNAFLIAFTSDFIQKLVYKYEYGETGKMDDYVMFTLSKSPNKNWIDRGQPECFYRGFRDDEGFFTPVHWKILAVKFAFVIIFEHVVFGVCKLIDILVPDIPASLDIKIKRERYLAKEALQDAEHVLSKCMADYDSETGHDTDTDNTSNHAFFRKQPSYENPCHTTPTPIPAGTSSENIRPQEAHNGSTNFSKLNRSSDSSPLLRQVVIQAVTESSMAQSSSILTTQVDSDRLSPCGERSSHQLVDNSCKVSPVTEMRPEERIQRRDTLDPESRMSIINNNTQSQQQQQYNNTRIINNKLSSIDSASTTDPGYQRAMSSPQRVVPPHPPSFRAQQSCPESLTVPSRRRPPPIEKQRTPPPIPARRKPPPV